MRCAHSRHLLFRYKLDLDFLRQGDEVEEGNICWVQEADECPPGSTLRVNEGDKRQEEEEEDPAACLDDCRIVRERFDLYKAAWTQTRNLRASREQQQESQLQLLEVKNTEHFPPHYFGQQLQEY